VAGSKGGGWNPDIARAWWRILRDVTATVTGTFMLVWQTVFVMTPNALIIGAGLAALGLPTAFRIDDKIRNTTEGD
jgi:hypothetical protein